MKKIKQITSKINKMKKYLQHKVRKNNWLDVADAAMDIMELEVQLKILKTTDP